MAQKSLTPAKPGQTAVKDPVLMRSFFRDDFPIIRKAGITFGVCLAIAVILIGGSQFLLSKLEAGKLLAETELAQAQGQYTAATNEKNEIREFQPMYLELVQRGFVGEEKRLDAIEFIHAIQENRKLLPITYEISPQQIVQIDPSIQTGELEVRGSKLVARIGLLHEGDMLTFLTDLSSKGMFVPQSCSIKAGEGARVSSLPAQLQGECSLYWITMGRRAPADGAPAVAAQ
jgi:hypothetical protein